MKLFFAGLISISFLFQSVAQTPQKHNYTLAKDVLWASPEGVDLTMDIYTPNTGKASYPVLIIYHGGGWLINTNDIMDQPSDYLASRGEYVVCNVNYRLLVDQNNSVNLNQIVEDALGALWWVKTHITDYKGNPDAVAVTGDSAGGQMAAMVVNQSRNLHESGFSDGHLGFRPTYIPENTSVADAAQSGFLDVQAAILSYPATDLYRASLGSDGKGKDGFETTSNIFWQLGGTQARGIFGPDINVVENPDYYQAVSPLFTIPQAAERRLPPQFVMVGSKDNLTTPALVKAYADALQQAGQTVTYWEYEGRPHAFLDSGSNEFLGISFEKDAPPALDKMIAFLNQIFYP